MHQTDMKPQDILFIIVFIVLIVIRKPRLIVSVGLLCLFVSIPLFAKWVFFTAERLIWYAAACFLLAIVVNMISLRDNKKDENRNRHKSNSA
jgi:hypothetical protein